MPSVVRVKMSKKARRGVWTDDETFFLIDTVAEMNIIRKIDGFRGRNQKYYRRISDEFGRRNLEKDWEQISTKWKNLKSHYYRNLKEALEEGQETHISWPFYEKMNSVLSERPRTKALRRKMSGGNTADLVFEEEDLMESDELSDEDDCVGTEPRRTSEEPMPLQGHSPSPNCHGELELPSSTSDERRNRRLANESESRILNRATTSIHGSAWQQTATLRAEPTAQSSTCAPRSNGRITTMDDELNTILRAIANASEPKQEEADADKLFLLSLHACVRSLSFEKNVQFRIGVMKLLLQLKNGDG